MNFSIYDIINESYIEESVKSCIDKNFKPKGKKSLSSFKKIHITEDIIKKYKKEYPFLSHVRCKDTKEYICDGYIWFDNDKLVCMVGSCEYTDDHTKWIVSLEIIKDYQGYGLSTQIVDFAVKSMNCKYLSVNKSNKVAKKVYDNYGFKVYHEDNTMYYMTIDKNALKSLNESYIEESSDKSAIDKNFKKKSGLKFEILDINDNKIKSIVPSKFYEWIENVKSKKNGLIAVESKRKVFAGFIFVSKNHSKNNIIAPFKVYEKFRGYGLGDILFKEAIDRFNGNELGVYSDNEVAIKLYEKYGFKKVDEYKDKNGDKVIIMTKDVNKDEKSLNESSTNYNSSDLYFISRTKDIKKLTPRIPDNFFTRKGYEDNKTPRVCFSTDIGKCLMGLSMKVSGQKYYVYQPDGKYKVISPTKKQVPDVEITDEKWICEEVNLKCIGEIFVIGDKGEDGIRYTYGPNNEYSAELYEWNWKWVKKYIAENVINLIKRR